MAELGKLIIPAVKGRMGDRNYFAAVMRMRDIDGRVRQAADMYTAVRDVPLSHHLQRPASKKRVKEIHEYLSESDERFFNSLVVAMHGVPNWRHFKSISEPVFKEYVEFMGFLELSGKEEMYALDGQHRLLGIQSFMKEAREEARKSGKKEKVGDELVGVLFVEHRETPPLDRERSRRLFTVLNKEAVKVSKKDIIYLDEDSAMAITTRALIEGYDSLLSLDRNKIYAAAGNALPRSETAAHCFTTVGALYDCLGMLFMKAFCRGKTKRELETKRLSKHQLNSLRKNTEEFFQMLGKEVKQVEDYFSAPSERHLAAVTARCRNETKGGHVLFRPAGLKVFVEIVCALYEQGKPKNSPYASKEMHQAIKRAAKQLHPLRMYKPPALNVVWDDAQKVIVPKQFRLLGKVYKHMLGIPQKDSKAEIETQYRNVLGDPKAKLPKSPKG